MTSRPVDILVTLLANTHQLKVTWRPDLGMSVSPTNLDGARFLHDGRGWTLPVLGAHTLLEYFRTNFPKQRVSFDSGAAKVIAEQLSRESINTELAVADDGDVPDVLSVQLRPFQRAALAYLLRGTPRKIVALDTGLGKTAVACAYARIRMTRTLWITKPALMNNLTTEIKKLTGQLAVRLNGTSPNSESIRLLQDTQYQHYVISYDSLSRSLSEEKDEDGNVTSTSSLWTLLLGAIGFDLLIVDEAHNMKNKATGRWKTVNLLHKIPSVLFLTATPLVNNGMDMYSLLNVLDKNTFGSPAEFTRAYLSADGKRIMNPRAFQKDLLPYMFRRKKLDVLKDLPAKVRQQRNIQLSDHWQDKYDKVLEGIYETMQGNEVEVPSNVLAQINRSRQVVSQAKVEHTAEISRELEESGEKTLVFTAWKETANAMGAELFCDVITGDVPQDERTRMQDRFNSDPNIKHLVLTLDVGREGLNLTGASAILFNDFHWTPMVHDQAEGRAWGRLNDLHGCLVYYVAVEKSIDSFMMSILQRKQEMIDAGVDGQKVFASEQVSMQQEFMRYLKENR